MMNLPSAPYQKRPIRFLELWRHEAWRLKVYGIASGRPAPRDELIAAAKVVAAKRLADVAASMQHYSVGFLGVHDGRTANFVFVDWWADENELHHHVYTSPCDEPARLTYATRPGHEVAARPFRIGSIGAKAETSLQLRIGQRQVTIAATGFARIQAASVSRILANPATVRCPIMQDHETARPAVR